jgi:hypothetical protein
MPETPRIPRHLQGLDPEKYAAIEAECEAREEKRRARARKATSEVVPPSPGPAPSETARDLAAGDGKAP